MSSKAKLEEQRDDMADAYSANVDDSTVVQDVAERAFRHGWDACEAVENQAVTDLESEESGDLTHQSVKMNLPHKTGKEPALPEGDGFPEIQWLAFLDKRYPLKNDHDSKLTTQEWLLEYADHVEARRATTEGSRWAWSLRGEVERSGVSALINQIQLRDVQIDGLVSVLEAVRSQMCWERDRDQLTMGMTDLHKSVTECLAQFGGPDGK